MNLKEQLKDRNLKWNWDKIAVYVVEYPKFLPELVEFSFKGDLDRIKNAAAVLGKIVDLNKEILTPYLTEMAKHLATNPCDAVKRATLRVFQFCEIPEEVESFLFDKIIEYLRNQEEAIAIKAFGMTAARKICEKYPELAGELIPQIEILVEERVSAGITARGRRELKILRKLAG